MKAYNVIDKTNAVMGIIATVLSGLFGQYWVLFAIFICEMIVDWISGTVYHKCFAKDENSTKGAQGAIRKVAYVVVIAIAFSAGYVFVILGDAIGYDLGFTMLIGWLTLAMFMVNEFRSILENCKLMGVPIPDFLIYGFDVVSNKLDSMSSKIMNGGSDDEDK